MLRDHTQTHHSRQDSSGRETLPDNKQHSQQVDIHAPSGIRTRNPSNRTAIDPHPRPCGHLDRFVVDIYLCLCVGLHLLFSSRFFAVTFPVCCLVSSVDCLCLQLFILRTAVAQSVRWVGYTLDNKVIEKRFPVGGNKFISFPTACRRTVGPPSLSIRWVERSFLVGGSREVGVWIWQLVSI
jgi:hypothetical protein